ncbi:MAG: hypothetical protein KDA22_16850 [Phycisphaerales bacterium]|nr:hypothetical protein [Phycisphaerales bacterium]
MRRGDVIASAVLAAIVLLLALPLVFAGRNGTSESFDQNAWHLPVVRTMAAQLPRVDLVNYESATAPGYHLVLALLHRAGVGDRPGLQIVNALLSSLLPVAVFALLRSFVATRDAFLLSLPLACSPYLVSSAVWITTDNVALLLVVGAMSWPLRRSVSGGVAAAFATCAAAAVFVRQVHLWPVAAIGVAGLLGSPVGRWAPSPLRHVMDQPPRWRRLALAVGAAAAPIAVVAALVIAWGGLTPPRFRDFHDRGANPATLAFSLGLVGLFGAFLVPGGLVGGLVSAWRRRDRALLGAMTIGMLLAFAVPTAFDHAAGRWGGVVWRAVQLAPEIGHRSVLIAVLAALGASVLLLLWRAARDRGRGRQVAVMLAAMAALVVVQSANSQCFQRYLEPPILIMLAFVAAAGSRATGNEPGRPAPIGGAVALSVFQFGLVVANVWVPALAVAGG